jgi:hypothetical protein
VVESRVEDVFASGPSGQWVRSRTVYDLGLQAPGEAERKQELRDAGS